MVKGENLELLNQLETLQSLFKDQECNITIRNSCEYTFECYVSDIVKQDGEIMFEVQLRNGLIKMIAFAEISLILFLTENTNYLYAKNTIDK